MPVKFSNKLSFTLGSKSLLLVIALGFSMSFLQTYFDFKSRSESVSQAISSIVDSAEGSAANAVYLLDDDLAMQVIKGLTYFRYFSYVAIVDDRGNIMAESTENMQEFSNPALAFIAPNYTESVVLLGEKQIYGKMVIRVNNHIALADVYERAIRTFAISVAGYLFLSCLLILLYHKNLALPLMHLAKRFERVNTNSITEQSIDNIKGHENNEFSLIISSANDLLSRIARGQLLLTQRSQRFRLILDTAPSIIYSLDNQNKFVFANKSTANFYGYSIYDLKGKYAKEVIEGTDPWLMKRLQSFIDSDERQFKDDLELYDADRQKRIIEMSFVKFHTYDGQSVLVLGNDITEKVEAEEKIEALAYYDSLTNLPNRNKVYEVLNRNVVELGSSAYNVAILADLDQFKRINDTLSHSVGDQIIVSLASRLEAEFKDIGIVARLGADEFLLHSAQLSNNHDMAWNVASELAERLRSCINKEIEIGVHRYTLSASLGVVVFKCGEDNADEILQYADTAMYESKRSGRNCVTLFKREMADKAAKLLELERDITNAMYRDEFYFVLQPIMHSATQKPVSAEALVRWQKNDKVVAPDQFIPFLEESSLIVEVGDRILNKVCEYIALVKQSDLLPEGFRIAVNISGKQLSDTDFADRVLEILRRHQIAGTYLEFEITESVALENLHATIDKINILKKMGITFSLDDFGTGYSSLNHLKELPVDKLKIDRSFINDITVDKQDENLVRSIIQLSRNLGLTTVAEGVETKQQLDWLASTGDMLIQGYYFSRPIKPKDFTQAFLPAATHLKGVVK